MDRRRLEDDRIHPDIRTKVDGWNRSIVDEVIEACGQHDLVVVGMAQNPHCKRARRTLEEKGAAFAYLEYGSYLTEWRRRLALKLWTGWPTFPMVFVKGTLIGGASELVKLDAMGELDRMLTP